MRVHNLHREQILPISLEEAWAFFSSPKNLEKITPNELGFDVITKLDGSPIYNGMLIEYRVRPLLRIPIKWVTKITDVEAPHRFVDTQLKGPYSLWEHTHTFKKVEAGVQMNDIVKYALPLGFLGDIAHALFVEKNLNDIFDYRRETLENYFNSIHI